MKSELKISRDFTIGKIDKRIYGSFIEHMGRAVYHGIYEPTHPTADENGFRQDVIELIKEMDIPIVRYPGGNFVSNYNWEDGVGPKELRPRTTDAAWQTVEPNEIGTDEFHRWAELVGAEVMMAVNLGTRGPEDAKNLYEYCNFEAGSKYADMRVKNGHKEPYGDKVWCLGNEMDGPWQVGNRTARDYAEVARKTAQVLKRMDPECELVACGSCNYDMPTFGEWEATVLDEAYDYVEYLSLHQYYQNYGDTPNYLAMTEHMDKFIKMVVATCDYVKGKKHSDKTIYLSFDEYNVWGKERCNNQADLWQIAPRREEFVYTMEDALLFGSMMLTLIKNCDRVKMACLAQLVNVAAPIMTMDNGAAWVQSIYYPFVHTSKHGRGTALMTKVKCETYEASQIGTVPIIDSAAVLSEDEKSLAVFAINRSMEKDIDLEISLRDFDNFTLEEHIVLENDDLDACNTAADPNRVAPHSNGKTVIDGDKAIAHLDKLSWNVIRFTRNER